MRWSDNPWDVRPLFQLDWSKPTTIQFYRLFLGSGDASIEVNYRYCERVRGLTRARLHLRYLSPILNLYISSATRDNTDSFCWTARALSAPSDTSTPALNSQLVFLGHIMLFSGFQKTVDGWEHPGNMLDYANVTDSNYTAFMKLSADNSGRVEGVFALPVNHEQAIYSPLVNDLQRGLYYLGRDMEQMGTWELCEAVDADIMIWHGKIPDCPSK